MNNQLSINDRISRAQKQIDALHDIAAYAFEKYEAFGEFTKDTDSAAQTYYAWAGNCDYEADQLLEKVAAWQTELKMNQAVKS